MITVDSLSRSYGDFTAVDQVSFEIGKGEIVGLLGHNGAGKTTIMKMLTGYLEPDAGSIRIGGHQFTNEPEQIKSLIGYLPENLPLYPDMLVADYLEYVAGLRGLHGASKWQAVSRAIHQTDLGSKITQPIATLSRGFKQRVGVAQAILHQPGVLILDEPTNGLDPTQAMQMRALIKSCAEHAIVILSTHIMQEVDAVCDRVMILRNGQLAVDENLVKLNQQVGLLLETDATQSAMEGIFNNLPEINQLVLNHTEDESYQYTLKPSDHVDLKNAAALISARVSETGHKIFSLSHERKDLETLFRQVNSIEGNDHA